MTEALVPVVATVVGAAAALAGVALGIGLAWRWSRGEDPLGRSGRAPPLEQEETE